MTTGYMGQILRVDLGSGNCSTEAIDADTARKFVGGVGYAARILYNEVKPGIDPLGPCLLYTSDAADDCLRVVPGGRGVFIMNYAIHFA